MMGDATVFFNGNVGFTLFFLNSVSSVLSVLNSFWSFHEPRRLHPGAFLPGEMHLLQLSHRRLSGELAASLRRRGLPRDRRTRRALLRGRHRCSFWRLESL